MKYLSFIVIFTVLFSGCLSAGSGGISFGGGSSGSATASTSNSSSSVATDTTAPTITNVTSNTANNTYGAATVIDVRVTFSEAVTVVGTPTLTLANGGVGQSVSYSSGSGTVELVFNYTVQYGDASADLDYAATTSLALAGGTIKDAAGNNATLTLAAPGAAGSLGNNKALVISSPFLTFVEAQIDGVGGVVGMSGTQHVTLSSDGRHVYASGYLDDSLVVFSRNLATGALTFVERQQDGMGGVVGLDIVIFSTLSPDGNHLYASGAGDNSIVVFSRNKTTGALTFVERQQDGMGGVDGLGGISASMVSPDGNHVYVVGGADDAIAVFSRNKTTGALTFVEMKQDNMGGVNGLDGAEELDISPDGKHVYVASNIDNAVAVFSRNKTTGALTFVETKISGVGDVVSMVGARSVVISPEGNHVYVVAQSDDSIVLFSRNKTTGALTYVGRAMESTGDYLIPVGLISDLYWATISPNGNNLYVMDGGNSQIIAFSRNKSTGALTYIETKQDGVGGVTGLGSSYTPAVSPDGRHVYAVGDGLAVFTVNQTKAGTLTYQETHVDGAGGVDGLGFATAVAVSPDGLNVYAAGNTDNSISVFSRSNLTGALTYLEMHQDGVGGVDGLGGIRSITVSPDSLNVYATGETDHAIAVFTRNPATGALTFLEIQQDGVGGVDGLNTAYFVALSPDGLNVYVAGSGEDAVAVFSRNQVTGALTYIEMQQDGVGGVDGIATSNSISISSDGASVYVIGNGSNTLAVFTRNQSTGTLTYVEKHEDGIGGVDGLLSAFHVVVSSDGSNVYATGQVDDGIAVFSRNPVTGALTYIEMQQDGVGGVNGLDAATSITISSDGLHIYAAANNDDAISIFSRNLLTGALSYVGLVQNGIGGVTGLNASNGVRVSPDGNSIYGVGVLDSSLVVFQRQ